MGKFKIEMVNKSIHHIYAEHHEDVKTLGDLISMWPHPWTLVTDTEGNDILINRDHIVSITKIN